MINTPSKYGYDFGLGRDSQVLNYIRESHEVQSRVSGVPCYVLQQLISGSSVGTAALPTTITTYSATTPNYRTVIWNSGTNHPDIRPYSNNGQGSVVVTIDGSIATRVIDVEDLVNNNEFAVIRRTDLVSRQIEIVFNAGFVASSHTITYYFTTMQSGITSETFKRGETPLHTIYGWQQWLNTSYDTFRGKHQLLVRFPVTSRDILVQEEGMVKLELNDSWCIWEPYLRDYDLLIVHENDSWQYKELRFEIVDKRDSYIQGVFCSQKFKVRLIEETDPRYLIPYVTT